MTFEELMDYAAGKGYQVTPFPLRSSKGFTVMLDGQFHIALAAKNYFNFGETVIK